MSEGIKVAVVGLGTVGFSIAQRIASESFPDSVYTIDQLILCSTDLKRTETDMKTISQLKPSSKMGVSYSSLSKLEKNGPDIVINCASFPEAKKIKNRADMGLLNMVLNRQVCKYTPENALLMIVTNHVLDLQQDAINSCSRKPSKTTGITLVDSIRARSLIEEEARKSAIVPLSIDACVIGDHDDGDMILSPISLLNNSPLDSYLFMQGKFEEIERRVASLAHEQIKARGNTSPPTAQAVFEMLKAVLNNGHTICGVECNFRDTFFREDGDYDSFQKPEDLVTMGIISTFQNLSVSLPSEGHYERWFQNQPTKTRERFYSIAMKRQERIRKLIAHGTISAPEKRINVAEFIRLPKSQDESYKITLAVNKQGKGFVCETDSSGRITEVERHKKELRKVGIIEGKVFATTRDSVYFNGKEIKVQGEYQGNRGINSFVKLDSRFFAAHSDLGLLCSENGKEFRIIHGPPAREAIIFNGNVYFASNGSMVKLKDEEFEYELMSEQEIVSLMPSETMLYVASKNELSSAPGTFPTQRVVNRNGGFISASKMENKILLLTERGVTVYSPNIEVLPVYTLQGFKGIASNETQAFVYNDFKIRSVFRGSNLTIQDNESSIISACVHSQPF